ncbi:MAG: SOUL heme-binding protein [Methanoregulaceae archaeon PtaU1.Bin059]|nr:MAG: SOUL heme-binding protein [Methanoregulaceae archaeon PtaB.Bin152]OPY42296.1 MAG: SOUL heme-binding protein [Methanoregulaceae archaeon PtaU1.Bin059]
MSAGGRGGLHPWFFAQDTRPLLRLGPAVNLAAMHGGLPGPGYPYFPKSPDMGKMTDTVPYTVIRKAGDIEFRKYPAILLASVSGGAEEERFSLLFAYITGQNRTRTEIPMTAPVITGEKIPMTSPVISGEEVMSFVMPLEYTEASLPEPLDSRITVRKVPERTIATIRFSGTAEEKTVREMTARLLSVLEQEKITVIGSPFLMRYNSPWTPGFLRRNEVGVEVSGI